MLNLSGYYERTHYPIFLKPKQGKVGFIICRIRHKEGYLYWKLQFFQPKIKMSHFAAKIMKFFFNGLYLRGTMVSQARIDQNLQRRVPLATYKKISYRFGTALLRKMRSPQMTSVYFSKKKCQSLYGSYKQFLSDAHENL